MWTNSQFSANLFAFTKEMLKGKLHFFWTELESNVAMIWKLVKFICAANLYLCGGNIRTRTFFVFQHIVESMKVSKMNPFQKNYAMENSRSFWRFWLNVKFPNNLVLVLPCFEPVPSKESFSKTFIWSILYANLYLFLNHFNSLMPDVHWKVIYTLKQNWSCRFV